MSMNNWGGVKEHLARKPRRFFQDRKTKRDHGKLPNTTLSEAQTRGANQRKSRVLLREGLLYGVVLGVFLLGILWVLHH